MYQEGMGDERRRRCAAIGNDSRRRGEYLVVSRGFRPSALMKRGGGAESVGEANKNPPVSEYLICITK